MGNNISSSNRDYVVLVIFGVGYGVDHFETGGGLFCGRAFASRRLAPLRGSPGEPGGDPSDENWAGIRAGPTQNAGQTHPRVHAAQPGPANESNGPSKKRTSRSWLCAAETRAGRILIEVRPQAGRAQICMAQGTGRTVAWLCSLPCPCTPVTGLHTCHLAWGPYPCEAGMCGRRWPGAQGRAGTQPQPSCACA